MPQVWFTADTHYDHKAMVKDAAGRGWRHISSRTNGFKTLEEMNETLIEAWNTVVYPGDHVYHLGDFAFANAARIEEILLRLTGQIHLVFGNHDKTIRQSRFLKYLASAQDYKKIKVGDQKVVLCHYPLITWEGCHYGSWHLHGHSHGNLVLPSPMDLAPRIDVGVDTMLEWRPYHFDEVAEAMKHRTYVSVDHHGTDRDYADRKLVEESEEHDE